MFSNAICRHDELIVHYDPDTVMRLTKYFNILNWDTQCIDIQPKLWWSIPILWPFRILPKNGSNRTVSDYHLKYASMEFKVHIVSFQFSNE